MKVKIIGCKIKLTQNAELKPSLVEYIVGVELLFEGSLYWYSAVLFEQFMNRTWMKTVWTLNNSVLVSGVANITSTSVIWVSKWYFLIFSQLKFASCEQNSEHSKVQKTAI